MGNKVSLKENKCLLLPGPVFIPQRVLQAMSKQMIDRRGLDFKGLLEEIADNLKEIFQTKGDVLLFPASGTAGLELAINNTLSPGNDSRNNENGCSKASIFA
jgi:aspartate aminotransferase-like enzyme